MIQQIGYFNTAHLLLQVVHLITCTGKIITCHSFHHL